MSPANALEVPEHVRFSGDSISFDEIRDIVQKVTGKKVELRSEDLAEYKRQIQETSVREGEGRPAIWIRYVQRSALQALLVSLRSSTKGTRDHCYRALMGEGKVDFSNDNQNELVNPGERSWKWKPVAQHLHETLSVE